MDDWEVIKSAETVLQTYEASPRGARHRTALVLRQDPERPVKIDGRYPPYALFLVEVASWGEQPNSLLVQPHEELGAAVDAAADWLGERRVVSVESVPPTALIGVANVVRDPSLLPQYAPR